MYNMIKIRNKHIHDQVYNNQVQPKTQSVKQNSQHVLSSPKNNLLESENTSLKSALEDQIELTEKLENQLYKIQMENKRIIRDNISKLSLDISTEINAQNIVFVESESEHSSSDEINNPIVSPIVKPTVTSTVKKTTLKPLKPKAPKVIKAKIANKKLSLDK